MPEWKMSSLERWLEKNNMKTKEFAKHIGCSRQILWKLKKGGAVSPKFAERIVMLTKGEVNPPVSPVGGS